MAGWFWIFKISWGPWTLDSLLNWNWNFVSIDNLWIKSRCSIRSSAKGGPALLLGAGDGSGLLLGTGSTRQPLLGSGAGLLLRDDGTGLLFWARIMRAIDLYIHTTKTLLFCEQESRLSCKKVAMKNRTSSGFFVTPYVICTDDKMNKVWYVYCF